MAFWLNLGFQNLVSLTSSFLESLHDFVMIWVLVVMIVVTFLKTSMSSRKSVFFLEMDSLNLEVVWTSVPSLILVSIAMPSLSLLCFQDSSEKNPTQSVKIISNQWNWQSEQLLSSADHLLDSPKVMELSGLSMPLYLPFSSLSRILLSSSDVLHSLGLPNLGIKLDSVPGRLNAIFVEPNLLGLVYGSCYELCGSGHSAMPISLLCSYFSSAGAL